MERFQYPHSIGNGAGERLTFLPLVVDPEGNWLELENLVQPGAGPPMHTHFRQEESLTVVQGQIAVLIKGEQERFFAEGETVSFIPGCAHRFWNGGHGPLVCKGWVRPADNIEYCLAGIYKSMRENGRRNPTYRPETDLSVVSADREAERQVQQIRRCAGCRLYNWGSPNRLRLLC